MTIERQHLWPTTIYTFKLDTLSSNTNEKLSQHILEKEKQGLGFKFNPIQGSGWQSNKDLFETDTEFSELRKS